MDVGPGTTIGGRYRVQRRAWDSPAGPAWVALDTVLERSVIVQTFPPSAREAVANAVAAAAQVAHPGLSQIYDISQDPPGVVIEHAPGGRLADRKEGAFAIPAAAAVVCQIAGALAALHDQGVAHGAVGPQTVMFDEEGRAKLAGAAVMAALGDGSEAGYRPAGDETPDEVDRYALAAIAYRLFTGREPGPDAPPARTARRSIPPEVDSLLARGLARDRSIRPDLVEFRRVLQPLASVEAPERGPGFLRQEARWLAPVLLLIGLGVAGVILGVQLDVISIGGSEASPPPTGTPSPLSAVVDDFDPPPGNGEENPRQTAFVLDGKSTFWSTVGYNGTNLDGRKKGVGLLFDLGQPRRVTRIHVDTPFPGWKAEWRTADDVGTSSQDFRKVADFTATADSNAVVVEGGGVTARYWLLWITKLVETDAVPEHPFGAQVSEVEFFPV